VATSTPIGSFPSPYEIETPPDCEGWEEMYPYYALFDERRREKDEQRFWFWNSMHFPLPMPAFDVACIDAPYQGIGSWQNRVFAVPPAMGIDYRCVNGYIYISGNPVTDPEKIAERAEFFQRRAGYYFEHWDELYAKWQEKMRMPELANSGRRRFLAATASSLSTSKMAKRSGLCNSSSWWIRSPMQQSLSLPEESMSMRPPGVWPGVRTHSRPGTI